MVPASQRAGEPTCRRDGAHCTGERPGVAAAASAARRVGGKRKRMAAWVKIAKH